MYVPYRLSRSQRRESKGERSDDRCEQAANREGSCLENGKSKSKFRGTNIFFRIGSTSSAQNICSTKKLYRSRNHDIEDRSNEKRLIEIVRRSFSLFTFGINATLILDPSTVSEFLYSIKERTRDVLFKGTFIAKLEQRTPGYFPWELVNDKK